MMTFDEIRCALALPDFDPLAAQARMAPFGREMRPPQHTTPPKQAGVLILIYPEADGLHLVLTRRTASLRSHSGQISFPGGKVSPGDTSVIQTALRETCEELGICDAIEVIGSLSKIYIPPSHFQVFPTVGILRARPQFQPNPGEVAEVFTLALNQLLDDTTKRDEYWPFQGQRIRVPYYAVNGHKVWGATAVMLSELEHRLRAI